LDAGFPFDRHWSVSSAAQLACVLEVTAPKVGNVHPGVAFADMKFGDFLSSSAAIELVFSKAEQLSVGEMVLESVGATRAKVGINTNLGTLLLFAPLAKARIGGMTHQDLRIATQEVLNGLTHEDSKAIYEAIRIAKPGGLGEAMEHDVHAAAPVDLVGAMRHAGKTDAVAQQYANGFSDLFERLVPWFDEAQGSGLSIFDAICTVQVRWLSEELDGLIVRKCGTAVANEVQFMARRVVQAEVPNRRRELLCEFDNYLRGDSHRRNPGTTADLIAAMLFVKLLCSV
jgi:triphosphoribosyl-dephospho-CoA synthase